MKVRETEDYFVTLANLQTQKKSEKATYLVV